jgi:3-hydroxybutyrate dehydrogenase/3-oxoacyl-[acyl-carrier protein] reductase
VTGATGIAHGSVAAMAEAGIRLVLAGRDTRRLDALSAELGTKTQTLVVPMDVTSAASVDAAVAQAAGFAGGRIDVLLNGHGMQGPHTLTTWDLPTADFDKTLTVNLRGVFLTMRAVLPLMIAQRNGCIVNIGGTYGFKGVRERPHYSASKWGLRGLTRAAALDAGPFGITVNTLCPGYVTSPSAERDIRERAALMGLSLEEAMPQFTSGMALRRFVEPEDIAAIVMLLIGSRGRNITGQEIVVDAGALA